ncbi:MAG TPA: thiamine pyrophosphate-requiring protein [Gemmatimonadaceae bacterium]|nr:thiamine pyrophosphate-requiring protein [Gemmatimonadaceae bacterium]
MPNKMVSDFILERLRAWGVRRIFGYPGDGINGVIGALRRAGDAFEFVQVANEELAGLMACAHAKYTGEIGVCLSTSGPGAIHMLNGLYDAKLDHMPVFAIVGQQGTGGLGGATQQEVDLHSMLKDVASAYVETVVAPEQVRHVIDRAVRIARAQRTVTAMILPHDVQTEDAVEEPPREHGEQHSSVGYAEPRVIPQRADLERAAEVLNRGERVAMLVGAGAMHATDEIIAVAELLGAGVCKALLGKAAVPDDLPFVTGSVGWLGTQASYDMMRECDTLFMVGSSFPYGEFLPKPGQARGVQIDLMARNINLRYPFEVGLVGDSAETLRALVPLLKKKRSPAWRSTIEESVRDWYVEAERRAHVEAPPINPQLVVWELSKRLPDRAIVAGDSGSSAVWIGRDLKLRRGMKCSVSGSLATMGSAVPYALAAKMAFPDRVAIAIAGDGAMQMSGINSLIDVSKYWRLWKDPRLIVLVLNNRDLNYVTWEQRVMEGEPKYEQSQNLPDMDYSGYAKMLGLDGMRIDDPSQVGDAWDRALAADRPFVLDAMVNADVPTLPPALTKEQKEHIDKALANGDPDAEGVRKQIAETRLEVVAG